MERQRKKQEEQEALEAEPDLAVKTRDDQSQWIDDPEMTQRKHLTLKKVRIKIYLMIKRLKTRIVLNQVMDGVTECLAQQCPCDPVPSGPSSK